MAADTEQANLQTSIVRRHSLDRKVGPGIHLFRSSFVGFQMAPSIRTLGYSVA